MVGRYRRLCRRQRRPPAAATAPIRHATAVGRACQVGRQPPRRGPRSRSAKVWRQLPPATVVSVLAAAAQIGRQRRRRARTQKPVAVVCRRVVAAARVDGRETRRQRRSRLCLRPPRVAAAVGQQRRPRWHAASPVGQRQQPPATAATNDRLVHGRQQRAAAGKAGERRRRAERQPSAAGPAERPNRRVRARTDARGGATTVTPTTAAAAVFVAVTARRPSPT